MNSIDMIKRPAFNVTLLYNIFSNHILFTVLFTHSTTQGFVQDAWTYCAQQLNAAERNIRIQLLFEYYVCVATE